jgi:hypothetical protein
VVGYLIQERDLWQNRINGNGGVRRRRRRRRRRRERGGGEAWVPAVAIT